MLVRFCFIFHMIDVTDSNILYAEVLHVSCEVIDFMLHQTSEMCSSTQISRYSRNGLKAINSKFCWVFHEPSGKPTQLQKISIFDRQINCKWAMFNSYVANYQKVAMSGHRLVTTSGIQHGPPLKDLLQSDQHYRKAEGLLQICRVVSVGLCHIQVCI